MYKIEKRRTIVPKKYPEGRRCTVCNAILSIYNADTKCQCHTIPRDRDMSEERKMCAYPERNPHLFSTQKQYHGRVIE